MPSYHSKDVADMVKRCLSLRPDARPSISRILGAEAVKKRAKLAPSGNETPAARVIDTIKLPRHKQIGEVRLPPAMYSMEIGELLNQLSMDITFACDLAHGNPVTARCILLQTPIM